MMHVIKVNGLYVFDCWTIIITIKVHYNNITMYITMCLYINITILLWVLSIYPFIKHYTVVILC